MKSGESVMPTTNNFGNFIDHTKNHITALTATTMATIALAGSQAEAHITPESASMRNHNQTELIAGVARAEKLPDTTVLVAGRGMTKPYIEAARQSIKTSFLALPKGRFPVHRANASKECSEASSDTRPANNMFGCIDLSKGTIYLDYSVKPWQIARIMMHELPGHYGVFKKWEEDKKAQPKRPSQFLVDLFITANMAKNTTEARQVIVHGPNDQPLSPDMRERYRYSDEAAAELVGSCAQAGFVLAEDDESFKSWISSDSYVEVPAAAYTATCNYLYEEFSESDQFVPTSTPPPPIPMGINYYDNIFCSIKTGNSAWPQWQRACRDSD